MKPDTPVYALSYISEVEDGKIKSQTPRGIVLFRYDDCVKLYAKRFDGDLNKAHAVLARQLNYNGKFPKNCSPVEAGAMTWLGTFKSTMPPGSFISVGKDVGGMPVAPVKASEEVKTPECSYFLINPVYYQKLIEDFTKMA